MKIWILTQESITDGWCGSSAYATPAGAVARINEHIDESNETVEEGDAKQNPLLYPVTHRVLHFRLGDYRYIIEPCTLGA